MRKWFRYTVYLIITIGNIASHAGSYDDFFKAVKLDNPGPIDALLKRGFDPNTRNPEGLPALYLAIREPSPKVVSLLLAQKQLDVDARSAQDESPLMMAALKGQLEWVHVLIERGADVNKPGWTPLHYAATGGHSAVIRLLLEQHAYIDAESPNGSTPLMMAAMYGTPAAVKVLLESGADPMPRNGLGLNALDFARRAGRGEAIRLLEAFMLGRSEPAPKPPAEPGSASE